MHLSTFATFLNDFAAGYPARRTALGFLILVLG